MFIFLSRHNPFPVYDSSCFGHVALGVREPDEHLDAGGNPVFGDTGTVIGRKQAFCIEDVQQVAGGSPRKYACAFQGLTVGWEDVYPSTLSCQWLDITGVAPGDYALRITANPTRVFLESNYDNNAVTIPVIIP
jgi:hypothetical protein